LNNLARNFNTSCRLSAVETQKGAAKPQIARKIKISLLYLGYIYNHNQITFEATVKVTNQEEKLSLASLGKYIAECLPKYVQKAQINSCNELDILIHPEGVVPVMSFLKDNHRTQFHSFISVTAVDVMSRQYRFEVIFFLQLFIKIILEKLK
jgi:hypothetical protein